MHGEKDNYIWGRVWSKEEYDVAVLLRGMAREYQEKHINLDDRIFWAGTLFNMVEGKDLGEWLGGQVKGGGMTRLLTIIRGEEGRLDGTDIRG